MADLDKLPRSKTAGPHLDLQVSYRLGVPLIYVRGELDHDTASSLHEVIEEELGGNPQLLMLDFSELSYMDSGGLSLMFDTVRRFKEAGWLGAVDANPGVRRLLELTGLTDHERFRLFPDLRTATMAVNAWREEA